MAISQSFKSGKIPKRCSDLVVLSDKDNSIDRQCAKDLLQIAYKYRSPCWFLLVSGFLLVFTFLTLCEYLCSILPWESLCFSWTSAMWSSLHSAEDHLKGI